MGVRFKTEFYFFGEHLQVNVERLSDVAEGFWVTTSGTFTKGSDCRYFILPHQITSITKVSVTDD